MLSNAELVRRTGLSKATVSRLTSTLVHLGFLRQASGGRLFELGPAALGIGNAYAATSRLELLTRPLLQGLAEQFQVSVALGLPDGMDIIYVAYRASRKVGTLRMGLGSILPIGTTAMGHALLWAMPQAEQQRLLHQLHDRAGHHLCDFDSSLRRSFDELALTGTCAVLGQFQRGAYAVAAPVRIGSKKMLMGLSCGKAEMNPDLQAERARISPGLLAAAARLEELLSDYEDVP